MCILQKEHAYMDAYAAFKSCGSLDNREGLRHEFHNRHNDYILQLRASNRTIDDFQITIPQVLEVNLSVHLRTCKKKQTCVKQPPKWSTKSGYLAKVAA